MKTQLVPVEPTKEMLDAFDANDSLHYNPANKPKQYKARHAWKAMLEAAPTPPETDGEPAAWIILDRSGDRRGFETRPEAAKKLKESGCELIPLYTRPDNSALRKAAEEALHWLVYLNANSVQNYTQTERAMHAEKNLRAALNKGES